MAITILGEIGGENSATYETVAEGRGSSTEIDLAGLEYSAFTSGLVIFHDAGPDDPAALDVAELLTAAAADAVVELMHAGDAAGGVFVDVGAAADASADAGAAAGFDPILTITEDSQAEIDVAAIF